jgi:hypothetical protein
MYHEWGRRGPCISYWWESQRERDHWEDQHVTMDLGEIGWEDIYWIGLIQDRNK